MREVVSCSDLGYVLAFQIVSGFGSAIVVDRRPLRQFGGITHFPFQRLSRDSLDLTSFFVQFRYKLDAVQVIFSTQFFLSLVFASYNSKNPYDVVSSNFPLRCRTI